MKLIVHQNEAKKQFETQVDGFLAKVEYIKTNEKIFLTHTEVPSELAGKGIGSSLVQVVLEEIEKMELALVPLCPFVAGFIKRNPHWKKIVLTGINIE